MYKCTDTYFVQSSPTTFFRKKNNKVHDIQSCSMLQQQEETHISQQQIAQRLKLIIISLQQESTKGFYYYTQKQKQLQAKIKQQQSHIQQLISDNILLVSHIKMYKQKFGHITEELSQIEHFQTVFSSKSFIKQSKIVAQNNQLLKVVDNSNHMIEKYKTMSSMSTDCRASSRNQLLQVIKKSNLSQIQTYNLAPHNLSQQVGSLMLQTNSNFSRKYSSNLKTQSAPQQTVYNIQICVTSSPQQRNFDTFISPLQQINKMDSNQSSIINQLSFQSKPEKQQLQHQNLQQQNPDQPNLEMKQEQQLVLGVQSKSSSFFNRQEHSSNWQQQLRYQQSEVQTQKSKSVKVRQSINCSNYQHEACYQIKDPDFEPLKTDSDIKRMEQLLDAKFMKKTQKQIQSIGNQINQKIYFVPHNSFNNQQSKLLTSKGNDTQFKQNIPIIQIKQVTSHIINRALPLSDNDPASSYLLNIKSTIPSLKYHFPQNKLKKLFQPFNQNINLSPNKDKLRLPHNQRQNHKLIYKKKQNKYPRQSNNLQKLTELFFVKSKSLKKQLEIEKQKQNKKLKQLKDLVQNQPGDILKKLKEQIHLNILK